MNLSDMSIQEKRELLTSVLGKGHIASVTYRKTPKKGETVGEVVTRSIKLWVEEYLTSGDRNVVGVNQAAENNPDIFVYADKHAKDYRSFKLSQLLQLVANKVVYK